MFWNPWHGCRKCSPGCLNCYVYYLDGVRDKDASVVTKSKTNFNLPLKKNRFGEFKIPSGKEVGTCFTSDFFIEDADPWREDAWKMIKERSDVNFLICTKRIARFDFCLPRDWETVMKTFRSRCLAKIRKRPTRGFPYFSISRRPENIFLCLRF